MVVITNDTALWRLNLLFKSRGWQVGRFKQNSIVSRKLGKYYIINFITNEFIDYADSLTPWLKKEFILAPWESLHDE